jgi:Uma2 family endonuclease
MTSAALRHFITVEEYLTGELTSEVKHEYIDGEVYAMAGASKEHIALVGNIYSALRAKLKGGPCVPYFNDLKIRLMIRGKDLFYYPDLVVGCDARDTDRFSLRFPKLIIEVMSPSTNRIDRTEKLQNYATIPSLEEYLLIEQDQPRVILHRRPKDWAGEVLEGLDSILHLESIGLAIPLSQIYEDIPGIV